MQLITVGEALRLAGKLKRDEYLRWDVRELRPGDLVGPSQAWRNGTPTHRMLNGTSALSPRHKRWAPMDLWAAYEGHVYIVTGTRIRRGIDTGEVILRDARVVRKLAACKGTVTP